MLKQIATQKLVSGCKHILKIGLFGLCAALTLSADKSFAEQLVRLENWRFNPEAQQLEVMLSGSSQPRYFYLAQPPRIVVDLPDTKLGYVPTQQNFYGTIQTIRVSQFDENVTRIVMDLAPGVFFDASQMRLQPISRRNSVGWVFSPLVARNYSPRRKGNYDPSLRNNYPSPYPRRLPYREQAQPPSLPVDIPNVDNPNLDIPNELPQLPQPLPLPGLGNLPPRSSPEFYNNEAYNQQQQRLPVDRPRYIPDNLPRDLPRDLPGDIPGDLPPTLPQITPSLPQTGLGNLPPVNNQIYDPQQQPFSVPPISPANSYPKQLPRDSVLPPAKFPNQPRSINQNNKPNVVVPDFPTPTILNNSGSSNNSNNSNNPNNPRVIEFGQPFPSNLPQ